LLHALPYIQNRLADEGLHISYEIPVSRAWPVSGIIPLMKEGLSV
jgi:hypothetical protein